jgi:uncharacterized membrane protein
MFYAKNHNNLLYGSILFISHEEMSMKLELSITLCIVVQDLIDIDVICVLLWLRSY